MRDEHLYKEFLNRQATGKPEPVEPQIDAKKQKIDKFVKLMSMLESSGGVDTEHDTMTSGIHKGSSAYGQYGLMPNTVRELSNRARLAKDENAEITSLRKLSDDDIKQRLSQNPELEKVLAERMAEHALAKQDGDEEKAAFAWQFGHNKKYDDVSKSPRVKKFKQLNSLLYPSEVNPADVTKR